MSASHKAFIEDLESTIQELQTKNAELQKERDCWLFNAQESEKGYNKLDKEVQELRRQNAELQKELRHWRNEKFEQAVLAANVELKRQNAELELRLLDVVAEYESKMIDIHKQNAELQEKNKAWALGVERSNTDIVDMQRDEFRRIMAITDNPEIKGLCERAIATIEQTVPVVVQRDTLQNQNAELRECLKGLVKECEYSSSSGLPFNFPDGQGHWTQLAIATKALAAQPEGGSLCSQ